VGKRRTAHHFGSGIEQRCRGGPQSGAGGGDVVNQQ
jgi:hypothetical protein